MLSVDRYISSNLGELIYTVHYTHKSLNNEVVKINDMTSMTTYKYTSSCNLNKDYNFETH